MQEDGYLAKILIEEGTKDILLGQPVAIIVMDKDDIAAFKDYKPEGGAAPAAPKKAEEPVAAPTPAAPSHSAPAAASHVAPAQVSGGRIIASPYAKKLAVEQGVNLAQVTGTGPKNRIVASDVLGFQAPAPAASVAAPSQKVAAPTASASYEDINVSQIRGIIAKRLTESKQSIPHYYVSIECEVDALLKLRSKLNNHSESKISVNDMIIKAASLAALKVPSTNSSWQGSFIRQYKNVDMSVAVSTPSGLITPIVKSSNVKGLERIATEMKELANRAKDNKLKPEEFQGGTFTISNMGMFGVSHFTAIINPPQSCILAIGSAIKRVVPNEKAKEGESPYRTANIMTVTLSSDHRVVDGADAAKWGQHFKKYIETPELMML